MTKNNMEEWDQTRKAVIEKCPYNKEINKQILKIKSLNIPPLLKLFANEAISTFIFGMFTSTFILCKTASEVALKYLAIEKYIQITSKQDITKSVIDRILDSDLIDLELILDYYNISTGEIKAIIGKIRKVGNIHVHGKIDEMIKNT